jgi:hypothetical protein
MPSEANQGVHEVCSDASIAQTTDGQEADAEEQHQKLSVKITPRDVILFVLLLFARYLTTKQIAEVLFAGRHINGVRERLFALANISVKHQAQEAYLNKGQMRDYDGNLIQYWSLTSLGYARAATMLNNPTLGRPPNAAERDRKHEPRFDATHGDKYIHHILETNQILSGVLAPSPGSFPVIRSPKFRWIGAEGMRLKAFEKGKCRLVLPDAAIELPYEKRRIFIEYETGEQPLVRPDAEGSAPNKADRYDLFVHGWAEKNTTWYARTFTDGFAPEVLFVTTNLARKTSLVGVIDAWKKKRNSNLRISVQLLDELIPTLRTRLAEARPAPVESEGNPPVRPGMPISATREELVALERCINDLVNVVKGVRHAIRDNLPLAKPPEYPRSWQSADAVLKRLGIRREVTQ